MRPNRTTADASSAITVEGELGYDEQLTPGLRDRPTHPAVVVVKDPKVSDLADHVVDVLRAVLFADTDEDEQPGPYPPDLCVIDTNVRRADTLQNNLHLVR